MRNLPLCTAAALLFTPLVACSSNAAKRSSSAPQEASADADPPSTTAAPADGGSPLLAASAEAGPVVAEAGAEGGAATDEGAPPALPEASTASTGSGDAAPDGAPDVSAANAALTVTGTVTDDALNPLAALPVNVLDATGTVHSAVTDSTGTFVMTNVAPPYIATVGVAATAGAGMSSYAGVTTATPNFVGRPATSTPAPSASYGVTFTVPPCGMPSCTASLNAVTPDGRTGFALGEGAPGDTLTVRGLIAASPGETIDVTFDLIVLDGLCDNYWYTQTTATLVGGAPLQSIGPVTPTPIPNVGTVTITPATSVPDPTCMGQTQVSLSYADGSGTVTLAQVTSDTVSCNVPDILGATLSSYGGYSCDEASGIETDVNAQTTGLPLTTTSLNVSFPVPPTWEAPSVDGQTLSSSAVLSWQPPASPGALSELVIGGPSSVPFVLVTMGASVSLADLAQTGVELPPGPTEIGVYGIGPFSSIDALLAPGMMASFEMHGVPFSWASSSTIHVTLTP